MIVKRHVRALRPDEAGAFDELRDWLDGVLPKVPAPLASIHNAIIGAFEGGANYWLQEARLTRGFSKPESKLVWWGHREVFEQPFEFEVCDPKKDEGNGEGRRLISNEGPWSGFDPDASEVPAAFLRPRVGAGRCDHARCVRSFTADRRNLETVMTHLHLPLRHKRQSRADRALAGWTKPLLILALRDMPTICPPRLTRQSKRDLERIVNGALFRDDADPVRLAMQRALADARSGHSK